MNRGDLTIASPCPTASDNGAEDRLLKPVKWDSSPDGSDSPHNLSKDPLLPVAVAATQEELLSEARNVQRHSMAGTNYRTGPQADGNQGRKLRVFILVARICWRLRWSFDSGQKVLANASLNPQFGRRLSPSGRFRACSRLLIAIARLRISLPRIRGRRLHGISLLKSSKWADKNTLHRLKSIFFSVLFAVSLSRKIHTKHISLAPLQQSLSTLTSALKLRQADDVSVNSGKCKALLNVLSMSFTYLSMIEPILDMSVSNMTRTKTNSACYYCLKELCRPLKQSFLYLQDCTADGPYFKVFAKLESVNTLKIIVRNINTCLNLLAIQVEDLVTLESASSSSSCLLIGHSGAALNLTGKYLDQYLDLQAALDISKALSKLEHSLRPFWKDVRSWLSILTPAEEVNLTKLLISRLKHDKGKTEAETKLQTSAEEIVFLKRGLKVDRRNVKVVKFRGGGSYGTVWEVECFGERYAMKTIQGVDEIENTREAIIQARLHHPHVVKLFWYTTNLDLYLNESKGRPKEEDNDDRTRPSNLCLLMELMDMGLDSYLEQRSHQRKAPLSNNPVLAVDIMLQVAEAMEYLHTEGVMHRDLKPSNVLVDLRSSPDFLQDGHFQVKLCDFGLAKVKELGAQTSKNTAKMGTSYYRAPEVLMSTTDDGMADYSFSADVYSYAMTCYEILTGVPPFGPFGSDRSKRNIDDRPNIPTSDMHPTLIDLIQQCWHTSPSRRPSFERVCHVLHVIKEELVFGAPIHALDP